MTKSYQTLELKSNELQPWVEDLGRLRLQIFREFPYLYEGELEQELDYIGHYAQAPGSMVVLAFDGGNLIGATTCLPMGQAQAAFQEPFVKAGLDVSAIGYLGESVVLSEHRGRGLGKLFFERRESHLRQQGCQVATFCAVERPKDHPLRPEQYRPLDEYWQGLGYQRQEHLQASFRWRQVDRQAECDNILTYWTKPLS